MIRRLGTLLLLALLLGGVLAGLGALGGWCLSRVLPFEPTWARAALYGTIEVGFVGLIFALNLRNRIGLLAFLVSLLVGAGGGLYTLFMLGALQLSAGPVIFSAALLGSAGFVGFLAPFAVLRPSSA